MHLNVYTLYIFELFILVLLTVVMFCAWLGGRRDPTLGLTAIMLALGALSALLGGMRNANPLIPILLGNMVNILCYAILWNAIRLFTAKKAKWHWGAVGPLIWALCCLWPTFMQTLALRIQLNSILVITFTALTSFELWRARRQLHVTFLPAMPLIIFHGLFYTVRPFFDHGVPYAEVDGGRSSGFFSVLIFEAILYAVCLSFIILSMVYERDQLSYKQASLLDPLTGMANRRAFVQQSEIQLQRQSRDQRPLTLILFDLDNFKKINDKFGHHGGDSALIHFCHIVERCLKGPEIFARIGGEEFACLTPTDLSQALNLAETIRQQVEQESQVAIAMTVSIGLTASQPLLDTLSSLLVKADMALYQAKSSGKNRIELN